MGREGVRGGTHDAMADLREAVVAGVDEALSSCFQAGHEGREAMRSLSSKATRQPPPGGCWRAGVRGAIRGVQPWDLAPPRPGGPCTGIAAAPRRDATSTELLLAFVSLSCPDSDIEHRGRARGSSLLVACSRRPFEQSAGINILLQTPDSSHHPRLRAHRGISHVRETSSSMSLSSVPAYP